MTNASAKNWARAASTIFLAAGIVAALAMPLAAQEKAASEADRPPKLNFTTHELPNGLKVILLENHEVPVIDLQIWYHVGGKDERPGRTERLPQGAQQHVGDDPLLGTQAPSVGPKDPQGMGLVDDERCAGLVAELPKVREVR